MEHTKRLVSEVINKPEKRTVETSAIQRFLKEGMGRANQFVVASSPVDNDPLDAVGLGGLSDVGRSGGCQVNVS